MTNHARSSSTGEFGWLGGFWSLLAFSGGRAQNRNRRRFPSWIGLSSPNWRTPSAERHRARRVRSRISFSFLSLERVLPGCSIITFGSHSSELALVRWIGPTHAGVYVPDGDRNPVHQGTGGGRAGGWERPRGWGAPRIFRGKIRMGMGKIRGHL
jgi:hypothetical protein